MYKRQDQDTSEFIVTFSLPTGSSLSYTSEKGLQVESLVRGLPGVASTYLTIGSAGSASSTDGSLYVKLVPASRRALSQQQVMSLARRGIASAYGVRGTVLAEASASLTPKPIQVAVTGPSIEVLRSLSDRAAALLASVHGVIEIDSSLARAAPGLRVEVDPASANDLAVSPADVADLMPALLGGRVATRWEDPDGETRNVVVRAAPPAGSRGTQLSLADIPSLPVASGRLDPSGRGSLAVSLSTASAAIASSLERLELPGGYASFRAPMARLRRLFRGRPTQP